VSGGEPLMQHRFVEKLMAAATGMGIHTALDTNGYYGDRLSDAALDAISLVLLDLKTWDPERHRSLTGMDNAPTLAFARRLAARRKPVWLRYVLVPDLTDDPEDIAKTAAFAAELGNVERVDVLPFHKMGEYKWEKLALPYTLAGTKPPADAIVERAIALFRNAGLKTY
jgi:pyruvate formate lyase activating enzyme